MKLRLLVDDQQDQLLKNTSTIYTSCAQHVINTAFKVNLRNRVKLHHLTYKGLRAQYPQLPSQLVISSRNKAIDSIKKNFTKSSKSRKSNKQSKNRINTFDNDLPIRYDQRSSTVNMKRREISLSVAGIRRITIKFQSFPYNRKYLELEKLQIHNSEVVKKGTQWFLYLTISAPHLDHIQTNRNSIVVGVDRNITFQAVTSNNCFYKGFRARKRVYEHRRRVLQKKGTHSAKRRLKKMAEREQRFQQDANHQISKHLLQSLPKGSTLVLEDLSHIRDGSNKGKKFNRKLHGWSFAQLREFILYKAAEYDIYVEFVAPEYTSQRCCYCGIIRKQNRHGRRYKCSNCGVELHADLNAARNIREKWIEEETRRWLANEKSHQKQELHVAA